MAPMRWRAAAPVTWPTPAQWDGWWQSEMAPLPNVQPEVDGSLAYDGERLPLRLLTPGSGGVLGAGARLAPYLPNAPGLSGEVVVSGRNRTVEGEVTLSPTPGFVTLDHRRRSRPGVAGLAAYGVAKDVGRRRAGRSPVGILTPSPWPFDKLRDRVG